MALFIGRLAQGVKENELRELFKQYGEIKRLDVKTSYAFVTYEDERDAEEAVEKLQGHYLNGGRINIEWAKASGRFRERRRDYGRRDTGERGDRYNRRRSRSRERERERRRRGDSRSRSRDRERRRRDSRERSRSPEKDKEKRREKRRDSRSPARSPSPAEREREPRETSPVRRSSKSPERKTSSSPQRNEEIRRDEEE